MRLKFTVSIILAGLLSACVAYADTLTLGECIETALQKHPDMAAAGASVSSKRAVIGQSASSGRPQLKGSASYTRSDATDSKDETGRNSLSLSVEQSIFDWGRRDLKIEGARLNADSAQAEYFDTQDRVVAEVRSAYYGLNKTVREYEVAQTRYENYQKRLLWARSYYEVGTKPKIEVTKAEADLANSKLAIVKANSAKEQYRAQLASAMGLPMKEIGDVEDVLSSNDNWDITIDRAIERALSNRPDLVAQRKKADYAKTLLALEKKGLSPELNASAGYGSYGSAPFDDSGWNVKLSLNFPLLDGGLTKNRILGAEADLVAAEAQLDSSSNRVMLEVRKAWHAFVDAKESLNASAEAEKQARETYDLAEGRYEAGVGSSLEISDAVEGYAAARINSILSLYECSTKRLDLEKAMGGLLQ